MSAVVHRRGLLSRMAFLTLAGLPAAAPAFAGESPPAILVSDFSPGHQDADFVPRSIAEIDGLLYFAGRDPQHGEEPWVSDGTPAGTRRLADICPGDCDSFPLAFTALGDRVLFKATAGSQRNVYAIENGDVAELATELGNQVRSFLVLGEIAYFGTGLFGQTMMRTDGTAAGTRPTGDFCGSLEPCFDIYAEELGGKIYLSQGGQLWVLAAEGDRRPLAALTHAQEFTAADGGRVVFLGCRTSGCRAYASDGTAAGTLPLEPAGGGAITADAHHFLAWRGRVYFANGADQMASTDGTPDGTRLEPSFAGFSPVPFAANAAALLYTVDISLDGPPMAALWARYADGGTAALVESSNGLRRHGQNGQTVFFSSSITLMATDGTPAGTFSLYDTFGDAPGVPYLGAYHFGMDPNGGELGGGLWRSDGTPARTVPVELGLSYPNGTLATPFALGSFLLASLDPGGSGAGADIHRVGPLSLALADPLPGRQLTPLAAGREILYATDRETSELVALKESGAIELPYGPLAEAAVGAGDRLYFTAGSPGQKLFESDGTLAGTRELFDLRPGYQPACAGHHCEPYFPQQITPSGEHVFFVAPATEGAMALWAYRRGAAAPAELLNLGEAFSGMVAAPGGRVVFPSRVGLASGENLRLWSSDGTAAGTRPFFELPGYARPVHYAEAGGRLFFTLDGSKGSLWVSDLTGPGTFPVATGEGIEISELVATGGHVYFAGKRAKGEAAELGYSDGTPAGTRWLDIVPGPRGSLPSGLYVVDDQRAIFAAAGDEAGQEPWISDGTLAGTYRLTDLAPGAAASSPRRFAAFGSRLFFNASDGATGFELWALNLPPARPHCPPDRLCLHNDRFEVRATAFVPQPGGGTRSYPGRRALVTAESGVFHFFSLDNWELLVKVLDACHLNEAYWVASAAASDVAYELEVKDRATGRSMLYPVPAGGGPPILDTGSHFGCAADQVPEVHSPVASPPPLAQRCADDPEALCLGAGGRFEVQLDWRTADSNGRAHPLAEGSADTGLFTFFSPSNWEMMIKVLDGCEINGHFWVFGAGTTDVGWTLNVTDRSTRRQKVYQTPVGRRAPALTDGAAFACRP